MLVNIRHNILWENIAWSIFITNNKSLISIKQKTFFKLVSHLNEGEVEVFFTINNITRKHRTIIRTGMTCEKTPRYMCDSDCRWSTVKKTKIFWSYSWTHVILRKSNIYKIFLSETFISFSITILLKFREIWQSEYCSYCFFKKITNRRLFLSVQSSLIYFIWDFQK